MAFSLVPLPQPPSISRYYANLGIYRSLPASPVAPRSRSPISPRSLVAYAAGDALNGNGIGMEEVKSGDGRREPRRDRLQAMDFRWQSLLYPDPENILAIGLTGLLTWASVQVLWQLFFISIAILLAAFKYSFIAALLLIILITLL